MKIEFTQEEADFLTLQLYHGPKLMTAKNKRGRLILKIFTSVVLTILGINLILNGTPFNFVLGAFTIIVAAYWPFFYPRLERRINIKYYKNFVAHNFKNKFGKTKVIEFEKDFFTTKDDATEAKITIKEIEEITEISTAIHIKLRSGQYIIIPKRQLTYIDMITSQLKELAADLHISYITDNTWKEK